MIPTMPTFQRCRAALLLQNPYQQKGDGGDDGWKSRWQRYPDLRAGDALLPAPTMLPSLPRWRSGMGFGIGSRVLRPSLELCFLCADLRGMELRPSLRRGGRRLLVWWGLRGGCALELGGGIFLF